MAGWAPSDRQVGQVEVCIPVVGLQLSDFRQQPYLEEHMVCQAGGGPESKLPVAGLCAGIDSDFNQYRFGNLPVELPALPGGEENIPNMHQLSKALIVQVVQ